MPCIVEMDIGLGEVEEPEEQLFDCCICSQCTPSTNERLVGLVTLLQPSSGTLHLAHLSYSLLQSLLAYTSSLCTFSCYELPRLQHSIRF